MFLIIENNLDDLFTFVELAFHKLLKNTSHKVKTIIKRFYNSEKERWNAHTENWGDACILNPRRLGWPTAALLITILYL